jgi:anti-sigma regulatory factor (Ser/Thr protein kinase)
LSRQTRDFPLDVMSVGAARRFANEVLADLPRDVLQAVELMVSELATNSIRHANSSFRVEIERRPDLVRVEVSDSAGDVIPTMRSPGPEEPTGRGLRIVSLFSHSWGITQSAGPDKSVWFTVADPQAQVEADVTGHQSVAPRSACAAGEEATPTVRRSPQWRLAGPPRRQSCQAAALRCLPLRGSRQAAALRAPGPVRLAR